MFGQQPAACVTGQSNQDETMTEMAEQSLMQHRRVLLADDDHACRMILGRFLGIIGFDVTYAENGKRALALFDQADGEFDMLVTDICMPEMSGNDLIQVIRQRNREIPIIAITGFAEPELLREIAASNASLFEKPVNFKVLRDHVDTLTFIE